MNKSIEELLEIVGQFKVEKPATKVKPLGEGLINDTFFVEPGYVLQRINHNIFTNVDGLQRNIDEVTSHIRKKLEAAGESDINRKVLHFYPTENGKTYYFDGQSYWRLMDFINDSITYSATTPEYAEIAGEAFGKFESMLVDIPTELVETIPDFHNMELRVRQLKEAIAENKAGRLDSVKELVSDILERADEMCLAEKLHREGKLPKRICHCDTKVNNMLFDANGAGVLCVIDLDTVMPSYVFSDFGDFMRTAGNAAAEDEPDLTKIALRTDVFEAFARGYIRGAASFLTDIEIANLPYAVMLFPYMQAVRFLIDYLNGDTYYRIQYPEHNLVRTKAQWQLFKCAEAKKDYMQNFINAEMEAMRK